MSKSIGNLTGAVLAIGLLAALSVQCNPVKDPVSEPIFPDIVERRVDIYATIDNFNRHVRIKVDRFNRCSGVVISPTIVATASDCIAHVRYPSQIIVQPWNYRDREWKARGLRECSGQGPLTGKVSFLRLEEDIPDGFMGIGVGTDLPKNGLILASAAADHGLLKTMKVVDCPSKNETSDDLCLEAKNICSDYLGIPILGQLGPPWEHYIAGLVFKISGLGKKDVRDHCSLEAPAQSIDLTNHGILEQFIHQANICE